MGKTKIDWCDYTWNPVWGCKNNCKYCYARKIAKRFGNKIAGRDDFKPTWIESNFNKPFPKKPSRIFMDSMSDIAFWKRSWMKKTLKKIKQHPEHTFMFLTKFPKVYIKYNFPKNCWLGVSITGDKDIKRLEELNFYVNDNLTFVSIEPLLEDQVIKISVFLPDWVIIGYETGNKKAFKPQIWATNLIKYHCRMLDIPLFMKESMKIHFDKLIQQYPEVSHD